LGSISETNYTFSLIDINGRKVMEHSFRDAKLIESVSVLDIAKGIYLSVLETSDKRITKKVIIE